MTYDEAIRFWYGRINYEVRAAKPEDLKLERMREFLHRLGDPQETLKVVHITGTKGKGSTAAMIAAIARAAGSRVGLFTSPHLVKVEERIQVDGESIPEVDLAALTSEIQPVVEEMDRGSFEPITFFEIVTAIAWLHFRNRRVDLAIMEVGLGGRFDSTNVCSPRVTVITNIGYDHMAQLGATLEEIAFQKAGIIKPGVPVVSGVSDPVSREIIVRIAAENGARLYEIERDFKAPPHPINLMGWHQEENAALAVQAVKIMNPKPLHHAIREGLAAVTWPARIEMVQAEPVIILDCAHNVPSVAALVQTLRTSFPDAMGKTCVFAVSADKQYAEMLAILATYFGRFILTRYANNPRCMAPEMLATILPDSVSKTVITPAIRALEVARQKAIADDLIAITGSVFLAGELRERMISPPIG